MSMQASFWKTVPFMPPALIDPFARSIRYLRLSVTDRCDLRCLYCMADEPDFLPKAEVLSLEELDRLAAAFICLGRAQDPPDRRRAAGAHGHHGAWCAALGHEVAAGALDELTLTTNGTQLAHHAEDLAAAGVRRINVSLDSLTPEIFRRLTRRGELGAGAGRHQAAKAAGLAVKINTVALQGDNEARNSPTDRLVRPNRAST